MDCACIVHCARIVRAGPSGDADVRISDPKGSEITGGRALSQGGRALERKLALALVTTAERYTHVATLQMKDSSERMDQALWGRL